MTSQAWPRQTYFIDCLRTGATPLSNGPESKKAVELVAAIYRSLDTGSPVPMPMPQ